MKKERGNLSERSMTILNEKQNRVLLLKVELYEFLMRNENAAELSCSDMIIALHDVIDKIQRDALKKNTAKIGRSEFQVMEEKRMQFLKEIGW